MTMRVGVASILQETNTFSPRSCTWDDFAAQGVYEADEVTRHVAGTNTEAAGAIDRLRARGAEAVPLLRAWAMSSGRLTAVTLRTLEGRLRDQIVRAGRLDGVVLSLHGAMAAEDADGADARLLEAARSAAGRDAAIGVPTSYRPSSPRPTRSSAIGRTRTSTRRQPARGSPISSWTAWKGGDIP